MIGRLAKSAFAGLFILLRLVPGLEFLLGRLVTEFIDSALLDLLLELLGFCLSVLSLVFKPVLFNF